MARRKTRRSYPWIFILMRIIVGTAFLVTLITAIKWHVFFAFNLGTIGMYAAAVFICIASQELRC